MKDAPARLGDRSPVDRFPLHGKHSHEDAQKRKIEEGEGLSAAPKQGLFKQELLQRRKSEGHEGNE